MTDRRVIRLSATRDRIGVSNTFRSTSPLAALIRFAQAKARVAISAENGPLQVEAPASIRATTPIHICLSPEEDVCFESDYSSSVDILDEPNVATFYARGRTEIKRCTTRRRTCVGFDDFEAGREFTRAFTTEGVTLGPVRGVLRIADFGDPAGKNKLVFPDEGLRIEFPQPVDSVALKLNNYAASEFTFTAETPYGGHTSRLNLDNEAREVKLPASDVSTIVIVGGRNESSLIELCFDLPADSKATREERPHA